MTIPGLSYDNFRYFYVILHSYATEISKTLLDIGFRDLGLHRISARCNANNSRSESVMKKIGMVKEGEIRKDRFKDGHWDNELLYGIIKPEWELFNT